MSVCYTISVAGAKKDSYDISTVAKNQYRFLDIASFLDRSEFQLLAFDEERSSEDGQPKFGAIPAEARPYAALSYPWRDLTALDANAPTNGFSTVDLHSEPPTSLDVLSAVCIAARQAGCKYLWMDKLSLRQDFKPEGLADRAWQMKRMYSVYEKCKVCLVAAGGMVRLPRLSERTSWINRAWTLQEALAPPDVRCLFTWSSGDKIINGGVMQSPPQIINDSTAMAGLDFLLTAGLHADAPEKVDKTVKLPADPDSQVYLFGHRNEDDYPLAALQGALERPNPTNVATANASELSGRRLGIWRCITMRSARYPEDFVFATMGIFGVTIEPLIDPKTNTIRKEGYPEDEIQELLDNFLKALEHAGCRADWFAVAPELGPARETTALPLVPDINYTKDKDGRLATPVKTLLNYWDRFNWYLGDALKYTVDAPNGIQITAPAHSIMFAKVLPPQDPPRPVLERRHDQTLFEVCDGGDRYAIAIGKKSRYMGGSVPPIAGDIDVTLLMLIEYIPFTQQRFRNIGYAWVDEHFTNGWKTQSFGVGLRGG